MCKEAKIPGNETNHSLWVYAATELFNAGISEKVIKDQTSHRSLDGLWKYEQISEQQKKETYKVSDVKPQSSDIAVHSPKHCSQECNMQTSSYVRTASLYIWICFLARMHDKDNSEQLETKKLIINIIIHWIFCW